MRVSAGGETSVVGGSLGRARGGEGSQRRRQGREELGRGVEEEESSPSSPAAAAGRGAEGHAWEHRGLLLLEEVVERAAHLDGRQAREVKRPLFTPSNTTFFTLMGGLKG